MPCYLGRADVLYDETKTRIAFFSIFQFLLGDVNNILAQSTQPKTRKRKPVCLAEQNCNAEKRWPVYV